MVPGAGQESVWDYPRPPRVQLTSAEVVVELGGVVVARTRRALRVLETSHPPVYYLPFDDVTAGVLSAGSGSSWCEFKGVASYVTLTAGGVVSPEAGWHYPRPEAGYERLAGHVAFYPARVGRATVDGEVVRPQAGGFYGGWVTSGIVGPFKGERATTGW